MPSTRSLTGLTSKEEALRNLGITALMVQPLSKRAQLLSSSILTWAMFSGPLQLVSGSGFKKGNFQDILWLGEPFLGMIAEWLLVSEGSSLLSLSSILSHLNSFSGSLTEIFQTIPHEIVKATTSKTGLILLLVQLNCIGKMNNIPNRLICSSNCTWGFHVLASWRLGSFFPFWLCIESSSVPLFSTVAD